MGLQHRKGYQDVHRPTTKESYFGGRNHLPSAQRTQTKTSPKQLKVCISYLDVLSSPAYPPCKAIQSDSNLSSHATYPQQTIPSTYFTHLADADVPSLFQDIASIRANTEIYRGRPRRVQPVRPDQILRTQREDRPLNPSDVLQYPLPSAANGGSQRRGQGDGLSTSHDASLHATFSPPHRPGFDRLDQHTPRGQLPSWHDGLPMEALGGEDIQFFNDGGYMSEAFLRHESPVLGPAFGPLPSAYSSTPNFPHSNAKSPDQELGLGHGLSSLDSVAGLSLPARKTRSPSSPASITALSSLLFLRLPPCQILTSNNQICLHPSLSSSTTRKLWL